MFCLIFLILFSQKCLGGNENNSFYTNSTEIKFENGIRKVRNVVSKFGKMHSNLNQLTNEIFSLMDLLKPTNEEVRVREDLIRRFKEAVAFISPETRVVVHGSYASGLYLPKADMDFGILNWTNGSYDQLVEKLIDFGVVLQEETVVSKVKGFDVVKTKDALTLIKLDITNFEDSIAKHVSTTKFYNIFPRVKPLFLINKMLLKEKKMYRRSEGGLKGTYLFWMIISFLQAYDTNQKNYGELLLEVFDFYGNLNYYNTRIHLLDDTTCFTNPFTKRNSLFSPPNCYDLPITIPISTDEFQEKSLEDVTKLSEVQQMFRVCHKKLLHALHNNHPHILSSIIDFNKIR